MRTPVTVCHDRPVTSPADRPDDQAPGDDPDDADVFAGDAEVHRLATEVASRWRDLLDRLAQ